MERDWLTRDETIAEFCKIMYMVGGHCGGAYGHGCICESNADHGDTVQVDRPIVQFIRNAVQEKIGKEQVERMEARKSPMFDENGCLVGWGVRKKLPPKLEELSEKMSKFLAPLVDLMQSDEYNERYNELVRQKKCGGESKENQDGDE